MVSSTRYPAGRRAGWVPVTSRSRSKIRATKKHAAQSIASRATANAAASANVGVITLNDISAVTAAGGRLASTVSCWATLVSEARVETARPTQIAQAARSEE